MKLVKLGDLISQPELGSLIKAVQKRDKLASVHSAIMDWLNKNEPILKRLEAEEILPDYFGYLLEHHLKLK
jgi:hypothetical protein